LREDYDKLYFNILDYTGTATRHFADSEFDGDPEFISEEEIDESGDTTSTTIVDSGSDEVDGTDDNEDEGIVDADPPIIVDPPEPPTEPRKYYVTRGSVTIATHATQDIGA